MTPVMGATLLLLASNVFMTFAWYAHLKNWPTGRGTWRRW
jgi:uncharacterized protein (DUF486 family)